MATTTTTLRPGWRTKMVLIIVGVAGLGLWGFYDATVAYPARGVEVARLTEYRYLDGAAGPADRRRSIRAADVSVDEPVQAMSDLVERQETNGLSDPETARLLWLRSLSVVGQLDPTNTTYVGDGGPRDPDVRLDELGTEWASATAVPNAVHKFDIAVQWLIFGVCMTIAGWCSLLVVRTASKRYSYDSETRTLTLPGGRSFTADDIDDIDKRKWHKYYVTIQIREDHPDLGGHELELDLYRRALIEDWILDMERARFPERVEAEQDAKGEPSEAADDGLAGEPAEETTID